MSPAHEVALERIPQQSCKVRTRPEKSGGLPSETSAPPRRDHCGPNGPTWFPTGARPPIGLEPIVFKPIFSADFGYAGRATTRATLARINPRTDTSHQAQRTAEECGRSTAWRHRPHSFPDLVRPAMRQVRAHLGPCIGPSRSPRFFGRVCVDRGPDASLYKPSRHAVRLSGAMTRLRSTSLIFGDQASDFRSEA